MDSTGESLHVSGKFNLVDILLILNCRLNVTQHTEMNPPIEAFIPTKIFTEESKVEVKDLAQLIADAEVSDAVLVYKLLQKSNIEIPADLKSSFFELICFYNSEEPLDEDLIEERWFRQNIKMKERHRKTWKDHDLAEQIFNEMEPQDANAFSTIIRGMCKFYQVEKAWALFNDAIAKNIVLDVEAFNSILSITHFLKQSSELRWDFLMDVLTIMKNSKVDPNLGTMNACLDTISMMGGRQHNEYCLKILTEFKRIGIEPSLASWYFVLRTFCKERGPVSHVIVDILNEIEGKEFQIRDFRDTNFFVFAMEICRNHLHDRSLAKRVDALLHVGDNYNLIGDSFKESVYYRNFFSLMVATEPLETFMETYHTLVPNIYIPEPSVIEEIVKQVEVSGAIEHIPILYSHMLLFDMINRENLLNLLTRIMLENKPMASLPYHEGLVERFSAIGYDMYTKIEEKNENRTNPIVWTAKLLGDIIRLQCRVDDFEKASEVFEKLITNPHKILGEVDIEAMMDLVELCVAHKQPSRAIHCLQYCNDIGFPETNEMSKMIVMGFTLDENHLKKIVYIAGPEIVKEAEKEKAKLAEEKAIQPPKVES
jgi:pentatricopeptide repeat domain-containing protein 3